VDSPQLVHKILRAYCLGLLKCCGRALEEIERSCAAFYEEEDFSMNTYGRQLLLTVSEAQVLAELDVAIEWVQEHEQQSSTTESKLQCAALIARLSVRRAVLVAMTNSSRVALESWEFVSQNLHSFTTSHALGKPVARAFSSKIQRRLASTSPLRPVVETTFEDASKIFSQLAADCIFAWSITTLLTGSKDMKAIKVSKHSSSRHCLILSPH